MASITFKQFLGQYGVRMLFVATQDIEPGIVLQQEKKGFFKYDDLFKVFGGTKKDWESSLQDANLITGTITRSLSLTGRTSLDEFGVSIHGGLSRTTKVNFRISDIKAQTLMHRTRADIETAIAILKKKDKTKYRRYANKFALSQTFFASSFEAEFDVQGNIDLRADLENKIVVASGANLTWTSKKSFKIASNSDVPFGFAGIKM